MYVYTNIEYNYLFDCEGKAGESGYMVSMLISPIFDF